MRSSATVGCWHGGGEEFWRTLPCVEHRCDITAVAFGAGKGLLRGMVIGEWGFSWVEG